MADGDDLDDVQRLRARSRAITRSIAEKKQRLTMSLQNKQQETPWDTQKLEKLEKRIFELEDLEQKIAKLEKSDTTDTQLAGLEEKLKKMEEMLASKEAKLKEFEEKSAKLSRVDELLAKLARLDQLDSLIMRVDNIEKFGGSSGGGGSGRTGDELKKEIGEVTKVLMDDNATDQQKAEANIKLEKLMEEYEKTPEHRAEVQKQKEERVKKHEPLNKAALEKLKKVYTPASILNDPELNAKVSKYPELKLITLEPQIISKMHESDFKVLGISTALSLEELRAIRANLPKFRNDQKIQLNFLESLDNKIEERSNKPEAPAKPKQAAKKLNIKKPPPSGSPDTGGLFAELLRKRGAVGGDDDSSSPPPPPSAPSEAAVVVSGPPPPPPPGARPPPPPPPPPGGAPSSGGPPPPPPPPPPGSLGPGPAPPPPPSGPTAPKVAVSSPPPPPAPAPAPTPAPAPAPVSQAPKPIGKIAVPNFGGNDSPSPISPRERSAAVTVKRGATILDSKTSTSSLPPAPSPTPAPAPAPAPTPTPAPATSAASSPATKAAQPKTKLKPPTEAPPKEAVVQLKQVKDSIHSLSVALKSNVDPKQVAVVTRGAVNHIMTLANMGKGKFPAESAELEATSSQLVLVVKDILSNKSSYDKFETIVFQITQSAAKTLGYTVVYA